MAKLTDEELRRVRTAGQLARGLRYFLYLVLIFVAVLFAVGLYIYFKGG